MGRTTKKVESKSSSKEMRPASTPEAVENQIIADAYKLAYKQIQEGTASSQVITHFLKLGSTKEKLEKEMMEEQKKLLVAKTEALQSQKRTEELYREAIEAMRVYSGNTKDIADD